MTCQKSEKNYKDEAKAFVNILFAKRCFHNKERN